MQARSEEKFANNILLMYHMLLISVYRAQNLGSGNYAGIILGIMMGQKNQELFRNFDAISGHNWHKIIFQIEIL